MTVDLENAPTIEIPALEIGAADSESTTESAFAEVLAEVMQVERVPVDSNFFDDLGADSMVMARFCARVRKRPDLPSVSIKDIYQHRTIKSLAAALADPAPVAVEQVLAEVLAEVMQVERVPVDSNFFDDLGADSMVMARFCARVRKRPELPAVSIKDIYQHRTIKSLAAALANPAPVAVEQVLAEVLAEVMQVERVSVDSNFFDDLGADSMVMARFCARVRKRPELPAVSIKNIYQHPTIKSLAAAFADPAPVPVESPASAPAEVPTPARTWQVVLCGALQLLIFLGYAYLTALVIAQGYEWISAGSGVLDIYLRSVLSGSALFLFLFTVPILAKWILIGRWKPQRIRIWSLAYVRFWVVKTLVRRNPIALFTGSPLFNLYLRALGAKIGRGVLILSNHVPICTDLLSIGDGTVIRKDSFINGYQAHAGFIHIGPITIGRNAVISEATVIDIDTSMGDETQLGHASSLHSGQSVPDGQRWHGSPGRQTLSDNFLTVDPAPCSLFRRFAYALYQLLTLLLVYLPVGIAGAILLLLKVPRLSELMDEGTGAFTSWIFYRDALVVSSVLFFGSLLAGFVIVMTVPRLLNLLIRPSKVYRLYGFYYGLHRWIARLTNAKVLSNLVGDTSWIVYYLRGIGYDLGKIVQTGANFGGQVKHESPFLSSIGTGTMVADALSMMNAEFSSTSFRLSRASIGARNFLGNGIAYPSGGKTGDNCLLATKVMVPISGTIRENVGLLGSPPFEIPRSVERDSSFDHLRQGEEFRRRLAAKNRHNFATILWCLFARWLFVFMLTVFLGIAGDFYALLGPAAIVLQFLLSTVVGIAYWILVDRIVRGFKPLPVLFCSLYELAMWRHERYWKVPSTGYLAAFAGTPFINMVLRRVGARIGRRVFNDGCGITERSLVTIGDDCTLNESSTIQCHSQEDGTFKSDYSTLGSNVTLGTAAHVHYGVTIGDGVVVAPDSFVMKGEEVPPHTHWGGNPASEMRFPAALGGNPAREIPVPAALGRDAVREMPVAATLSRPAKGMAVPAGLGRNPAREILVPAALDRNPAREILLPAALAENPTRRIPFPVGLSQNPVREMPVRVAPDRNSSREMPIPAALAENPTRKIPFPIALDQNPTREMQLAAELQVRQDRHESRSAALVSTY